jgi:NAD(P)-dependent dehydrogenase (short-subunit alcohol dehydrogenase family)
MQPSYRHGAIRVGALDHKVIVVTGAGRGIGRAVALLAASEGAKVVVNDAGGSSDGVGADAAPAEQVAGEIEAAGGIAVPSTDSVADWDGAQRIVAMAITNFGRVDGVVNNAGILRDRIFHQLDPTDFDTVIRVHLHGAFYVARSAAPYFRKQQSGTFVHMTSTSGLVGNYGQANYSAAKLGIVGLSKSIALDMARFNVRSNCIAPFAWSRLIGTMEDDQAQAHRVTALRTMTAEQIAPMAVFLVSDLSAGISGQIFGVRRNEIFLFSQPRPIRSIHCSEGWNVKSLVGTLKPALMKSLVPLERSEEVFAWDPV